MIWSLRGGGTAEWIAKSDVGSVRATPSAISQSGKHWSGVGKIHQPDVRGVRNNDLWCDLPPTRSAGVGSQACECGSRGVWLTAATTKKLREHAQLGGGDTEVCAYFLGACAWMAFKRCSSSFIWVTNRCSTFRRSELFTMLKLVASRTTLAGSERSRVTKP